MDGLFFALARKRIDGCLHIPTVIKFTSFRREKEIGYLAVLLHV